MTKILYAVPVYDNMEENDVKITYGGIRSEFKNEEDRKFLISNLTRCKNFYWKSDKTKKLYFKIWRVAFFSIQNLRRCIFSISKSDTQWNFQCKIMLFKLARKMQHFLISRSKIHQNVNFLWQTVFQNLTCPKNF